MSCNYADGLSPYHDKGKLGLKESFDKEEDVKEKVAKLAKWIAESKHVVVHTGAGISTSAGIPDFRGPKGVWTLEAKGEKPTINVSFDDAVPTKTHMALKELVKAGKIHFVVSQNIDGLHLRSGLPRANLAELHGNMFVDQCNQCESQYIRHSATTSVGQKCLGTNCPNQRLNGRPCRGRLHDTILDWEHSLPEKELALSDFHSCVADLSICLGTTLQIIPSGNLPLHTKKHGESGRLVICNLQPTKHDKKADLLIRTYVDDILEAVCQHLGVNIPPFTLDVDPTKQQGPPKSWTIFQAEVKRMRKIYEDKCCKGRRGKVERKRSLNQKEVKQDINQQIKKSKQNVDDKPQLAEGCKIEIDTPDDTDVLVKKEKLETDDQRVDVEYIPHTKKENNAKDEIDSVNCGVLQNNVNIDQCAPIKQEFN